LSCAGLHKAAPVRRPLPARQARAKLHPGHHPRHLP